MHHLFQLIILTSNWRKVIFVHANEAPGSGACSSRYWKQRWGGNPTGIRTSAAWLPGSWSCQVSQCHSPGVASALPHCSFALPGQHCQLQAPALAFYRVCAALLAQHSSLVLLLSSQADVPEPAKNSCRLTSPLLSPLTPTIFFYRPSTNFHVNDRNLTPSLPPEWVRIWYYFKLFYYRQNGVLEPTSPLDFLHVACSVDTVGSACQHHRRYKAVRSPGFQAILLQGEWEAAATVFQQQGI